MPWDEALGCVMEIPASAKCRWPACSNSIPLSLTAEQLCLDHFLDEAFVRTEYALAQCRQGQPVNSAALDWVVTDAQAVAKNLAECESDSTPEQRERILELLLILANLHEYLRQHSVPAQHSS